MRPKTAVQTAFAAVILAVTLPMAAPAQADQRSPTLFKDQSAVASQQVGLSTEGEPLGLAAFLGDLRPAERPRRYLRVGVITDATRFATTSASDRTPAITARFDQPLGDELSAYASGSATGGTTDDRTSLSAGLSRRTTSGRASIGLAFDQGEDVDWVGLEARKEFRKLSRLTLGARTGIEMQQDGGVLPDGDVGLTVGISATLPF